MPADTRKNLDIPSERPRWMRALAECLHWGAIAFVAASLWIWYRPGPVDMATIPLALCVLPNVAVLTFVALYVVMRYFHGDFEIPLSIVADTTSGAVVLLLFTVCVALFAASAWSRRFGRHYRRGFRMGFRPVLLLVMAISLGLLVFTTWNPLKFIAWLGIGSIVVYQTRIAAENESPRPSLTSDAVSALLIVISCGTSLVVFELGLSLIPGPAISGEGIYRSDERYLFMPRPNSFHTKQIPLNDGGAREITVSVGPQGFRNPPVEKKAPGEYRIVLLGDSYTMGHAVLAEETIPHILQSLLSEGLPGKKVSVVNAGLSAAGPIQEYGILMEQAMHLEPDAVILQLYPSNDIDNSLVLEGEYFEAFQWEWVNFVEYYRRLNRWHDNAEYWLRNHSRAYMALVNAYDGAWVFSVIFSRPRFSSQAPPAPSLQNAPRTFSDEIDLAHWYPTIEHGLAILREYIAKMHEECRQRGIPLSAYCIPRFQVLDEASWAANLKINTDADPTIEYVPLKGFRAVEDVLASAAIPTIDVLEALSQFEDIRDYYYVYDGHFTPEGNRVVAERLYAYVRTTLLDVAEPVTDAR